MSKTRLGLALLIPATALAAQYRPASAYIGDYDLSCESATLSLHLGVGYTATTGEQGDWSEVHDLTLPCQTPVADIQAFADDVFVSCEDAGLPTDVCDDAANQIFDALLPFADLGTEILPNALRLNVDTANWFSRWTGAYSAYGWHRWADGRLAGWGYLLDNNAGPAEGHLAAVGVGIGESAAADGAGCAVVGAAAVDGRINPLDAYTFSADFGVNQNLVCALGNSAGVAAATIGVTFHGSMTGTKVP